MRTQQKAVPGPGDTADTAKPDSAPMTGKIALEEHFVLPETVDTSYAIRDLPTPRTSAESPRRGQRTHRGDGPRWCRNSVSSRTSRLGFRPFPAFRKISTYRGRANDYLAEHIAKYPKRLKGFAALPLQDPQAAAHELTRGVKELGFCGALVNGFSQIGEADSAVFYDLPQYRLFWATVQELDVPFYLHPRAPLATRRKLTKDTRGLPARPGDSRTKLRFTPA
jgi:hypothetical protein